VGPPCEREAEELQPDGGGGRRAFQFERRLAGGDEKQPVQTQFLHRRLRDEQVPEMHRIK
jgi:hypothetical protein